MCAERPGVVFARVYPSKVATMKLLITPAGPSSSLGFRYRRRHSFVDCLVLSVHGAAIGMSAFAPLSSYNPLEGYGFSLGLI